MELTAQHQQLLLDAARAAIVAALARRAHAHRPAASDPMLLAPCGCFVSLHEMATHRLRGCVGRIVSEEPLLNSVMETAASCLCDPRFGDCPISILDLPRLEIELSILSPLVAAPDPMAFDPLNDGIYLQCHDRTGTFLPQVARQTGWTRQQLLARLCTEKLGLPPTAWREPGARLLTYKVQVIGPVPFYEITQPATSAIARPGSMSSNIFRI